MQITLIIPYYEQPLMLARQMEEVAKYPSDIKVIVVDDCSPEPAEVIEGVDLYRIEVDVPWNREQARNIGAYVCKTEWLIQVDTDHILPVDCIEALLEFPKDPLKWYRFPRWRVGRADETRKKDPIHHLKKYGQIKPHIDSYLITRKMFLTSPYDERYSGCLGGGTPFLERMKQIHGEPEVINYENVRLEVHTRHSIADASIEGLSRDKTEYTRRRAQICDASPTEFLFQPWHKVN